MSFSAGQFALLGLMAFALTGLLTWPVRLLGKILSDDLSQRALRHAKSHQNLYWI